MSLICWIPVWFAAFAAGELLAHLVRGDDVMPRIPVVTPTWEWIRARIQDVIDRIVR